MSREAIEAVACREGWPTQDVETGLFRIVKLWIDGTVLVELFAKGEAERYVEAFGEKGMASLDARLRGLEAKMAAALAAKMTPAQRSSPFWASRSSAKLQAAWRAAW